VLLGCDEAAEVVVELDPSVQVLPTLHEEGKSEGDGDSEQKDTDLRELETNLRESKELRL
jgi:hypothetical protein